MIRFHIKLERAVDVYSATRFSKKMRSPFFDKMFEKRTSFNVPQVLRRYAEGPGAEGISSPLRCQTTPVYQLEKQNKVAKTGKGTYRLTMGSQ